MKKAVLLFSVFCLTLGLNAQVIITEIHYDPCTTQGGDGSFEFIEIFNGYSNAIDLEDWSLGGVTYTFPAGISIASGEYLVLTIDATSYVAGMNGVPAGTQVIEWTSGGIINGGEPITLLDECDNTVDAVTYDEAAPWPTDANGNCASLQFTGAITDDNNDPANWTATADTTAPLYGTTPGTGAQSVGATSYTPPSCVSVCEPNGDLIITEIVYNPCTTGSLTSNDEYVEIYNNGAAALSLEGYVFADASNTYTFPIGSSVPAGGYIVVTKTAATFDGMAGLVLGTNLFDWGNWVLNNDGDDISITDCEGNLIDMLTYDDNAGSWGTCADGNDCVALALPLDNYSTDNAMPSNWATDGRGIGPSGPLFTGVGSPGAPNLATTDAGFTTCNAGISVAPKVFLQGSLSGTSMSLALNTNMLIPNMDPYFGLTFPTIPANAVDYVLVELRTDTTTPGTPDVIVASRIAFLLDDGSVVNTTDGTSAVPFPTVSPGDYYVAIKHRNHLSVVTATAVTLN